MTRQSIDDLINAGKLASLTLPESSTMKTIQKAMNTMQSDHLASLALPESPAMKSFRKAMNTMQSDHLASLALPESSAMKSFRKAMEAVQSDHLASLALPESPAMKTIQKAMNIVQSDYLASLALPESSAVKSIQKAMQASKLASLAFQKSASMKSIREIIDSHFLIDLVGLSSLKAVSQLENSPFSSSALSAYGIATANAENVNEAILEIDSELNDEVSSATDFNQLSEKAKSIFLYIYHHVFSPLLVGMLGTYIMMNIGAEARNDLKSVSSLTEVYSYTRTASLKLDRNSLKGFRVTTANSLKLRKSPNMSAETIDFLPLGTLVEVIDRSNRSWLFVEVEMDGELIQGWVSRKYTAYFK